MTNSPNAAKVAKLLKAMHQRKVDPDHLHLISPKAFPGLVVVGEQITTHAATLRAVVLWDEHDVKIGESIEMVPAAMARAGWAEADPEERRTLAETWVYSVELAFKGAVQRKPLAIFGRDGRPPFEAPTYEFLPDGGVEIRLWLRAVEKGKSSTRRFDHLRFVFSKNGGLSARGHLDGFNVPNKEWREAL